MSDTFTVLVTDDDNKTSITQTVFKYEQDGIEHNVVWTSEMRCVCNHLASCHAKNWLKRADGVIIRNGAICSECPCVFYRPNYTRKAGA